MGARSGSVSNIGKCAEYTLGMSEMKVLIAGIRLYDCDVKFRVAAAVSKTCTMCFDDMRVTNSWLRCPDVLLLAG